MDAEPAAKAGADGLTETAELPLVSSESGGADPAAHGPRLNTFTRLARFSRHTRRWHSINRAFGERDGGTDDDMPTGNQ